MKIFILIASIGSLINITPVLSQSCTVRDRATQRNVQCEFPFKFEGETHYGCIDYIIAKNGRKVPGRPWCSTKVSGSQREHVKGGRHFGNCDDSCPDAEEGLRLHQQSQNKPSSSATGKNSGLWKPNADFGECGKRITVSNIVGGRRAKIGEYPWMALLGYDSPNVAGNEIFYVCGGSLINKKYVLTAAHCIDTGEGRPVEVVLGEHVVGKDPDCSKKDPTKCNPPVIRRNLDQQRDIIVHEGYDKKANYKHDIALIRINDPVPLFQENPQISAANPICLPWSEDNFAYFIDDGDFATVAGWGRTRRKNSAFTSQQLLNNKVNVNHLQQLKVPIANGKCEARPKLGFDKTRQICAGGEKGKDSCSGDSGGPLFARESTNDPWTQVGLVSFGTAACGIGIPGIYTRVTNYLDWIDSHLKP